jgi:hypothetical protein
MDNINDVESDELEDDNGEEIEEAVDVEETPATTYQSDEDDDNGHSNAASYI